MSSMRLNWLIPIFCFVFEKSIADSIRACPKVNVHSPKRKETPSKYKDDKPIVRLPTTVRPELYELHIRPYFPGSVEFPEEKMFTFDGFVKFIFFIIKKIFLIALKTTESISSVSFHVDPTRITIDSIDTENGVNALEHDLDSQITTLNLSKNVSANELFHLTINFTGLIPYSYDINGGFVLCTELENGKASYIFATTFEPFDARQLTPCWDEPDFKAIWQVSIDHASDYIALANGQESLVEDLGNGLTRTIFKPTLPMSSYLLALGVGDLVPLSGISNVDQIRVQIWSWRGMEDYLQEALKIAIATLDFMSTYTAQPFPMSKLDYTALPLFDGAMENWGLAYSDFVEVFYDPDYSTLQDKLTVYSYIAHELSHQWFGDLVTCKWWDLLFLNEGFASYFSAYAVGETIGKNQKAYINLQWMHEVDQTLADIEPTIPPNSQPSKIGYNTYTKPQGFLRMLRDVIGEDVWQQSLQNYLKEYKFDTATDKDLWSAIQTAVNEKNIIGWNETILNVSHFMDAFTHDGSYPIIKVSLNYNGSVTLRQHTHKKGDDTLWVLPIWTIDTNGEENELTWLIEKELLIENDFLFLNPGRRAYFRTCYEDESILRISDALLKNSSVLDELSKTQFLKDIVLCQDSWINQIILSPNITGFLANDDSYGPWAEFQFQVDAVLESSSNETEIKKLKATVLSYLKNKEIRVNASQDDWNAYLKSKFFWDLALEIGDPRALRLANETFVEFIQNCGNSVYGTGKCNKVPPEFRSGQFCYGLRQNPQAKPVVEQLIQWFKENSYFSHYFSSELNELENSLKCLNNSKI